MSQHLPVIAAREAIRIFGRAGYHLLKGRGKGSHSVMTKPGANHFLTIPNHDPIRRGTMRALLRQAGMSVEEFRNLM